MRAQADDAQVVARLRQRARDSLRAANRDPDDEATLKMGLARERKDWIRSELTERGIERAKEWGWPNIYTYTKSIGDQLVARETGVVRSIVRPAIVESSIAYPFRGWNEGYTTSAPLVYLALKGQAARFRVADSRRGAGGLHCGWHAHGGGAGVRKWRARARTGQRRSNPSRIGRVTTLTWLYKRQRFRSKETVKKFLNGRPRAPSSRELEDYDRMSLPLVSRATENFRCTRQVRPSWAVGFRQSGRPGEEEVDNLKRITKDACRDIDLFRPFILHNAYACVIHSCASRSCAAVDARLCRGRPRPSTGTTTP